MPIDVADTESSGGLNNESQQLTCTGETVMLNQEMYHEKTFPRISKAIGLQDWNLKLHSPNEEDEKLKYERCLLKIQAAREMVNMGFDAVLLDDDFKFRFEGEGKRQEQVNPFGQVPNGEQQEDDMLFEEPEEEMMALSKKSVEKSFDRMYSLGGGVDIYLDNLIKSTVKDGLEKGHNVLTMVRRIESDNQWKELAKNLNVEVPDIRFKLERIIRMESLLTNNERFVQRYKQLDPTGEKYRYRWGGPNDDRTTEISKRIKSNIPKEGVTLKRLKELIKQIPEELVIEGKLSSSSLKIVNPDKFVTHINQRHRPIRTGVV
jgi:hypothetical protein